MKNKLSLLIAICIASTTFLMSCKKSYKCECQGGVVENVYLKKMSKSKSETEKVACESLPTCEFKRNKN